MARSPARSDCSLRTAALLLVLAALLILPGCWIYSVEPLYEEHPFSKPDPDLSFDQSLVGSWGSVVDGCQWTLTVTAYAQVYQLTWAPGQGCATDEKTSDYDARLVKLDNHEFLDVFAVAEEVCDLCLPVHSFFLVVQQNDSLQLIPLDFNWMVESMNSKKVVLSHLPQHRDSSHPTEVLGNADAIVLTPSPSELKRFMRQYADDKSAFKAESDAAFKLKRK